MDQLIRKNTLTVLEEKKYENPDGSQLLLLEYPSLNATGIVEHCFSTRVGGVSEGMFSTMNLSFTRGDVESAVRENYHRIALAKGWKEENMVFSDQTHTTNVRLVTEEDRGKGIIRPRDYTDTDGLITNVPGLVLATFYADCVPLFLVDPVNRAIGLSHSGWRGTVNRMGLATIKAMEKAFGTKAENLVVAIGPSICRDCYEVSLDVAEEFEKAFPGHEEEILKEKAPVNGERKFLLDLWRANELVFEDAGVLKDKINTTNICTCCNPDLLFSHRASHGKRGNLGAFLSISE